MYKKLKDKIKHHFQEVMHVKTSPNSIALGFAIGAFIAILPTFGFGLLIGLLVILIFQKVNKFSMIIAFAVFNPLMLTPIYLLSYKLGYLLFGNASVVSFNIVLLDQIYHFSRRFLVGNLIIAIIISIPCYFLIRYLVWLYRKVKQKK
ncbi:MAG: DUF2062 domain-containing protein [Nanoarchaeota archaeon]|nr:DUF2062 domain-containing protein [Nanoarchaeota archaeon]MBU1322058.1 DUF2062 domain-containing protein [Nanoarchaeota archaeon]MBU1597250.1 DUF2062 domain-containing protein [Nanoarchaeota archaeon]MBU2440705.1 DUF2062 domain-containing protein [Nanoarchaeota archaeon]